MSISAFLQQALCPPSSFPTRHESNSIPFPSSLRSLDWRNWRRTANSPQINYQLMAVRGCWYRISRPKSNSLFSSYHERNMEPAITVGGAGQPPTSLISIKHRRTRSGCFTCRARRVKVSESSLGNMVPILMATLAIVWRATSHLRKSVFPVDIAKRNLPCY